MRYPTPRLFRMHLGALLAASATLACRTGPAPSSAEVGDAMPAPTASPASPAPPAPTVSPTVDVLVGDAARYARERLGMPEPRLAFVRIGCVDSSGTLDPRSDRCAGSVVATFEDDSSLLGDPAFVAIGARGLTGTRAPRGSVVSVAPARCTPGALLATARTRGLSWERANDFYVSYGPRKGGGAIWTVGPKDAPMLTSTDDECVATAAGAGQR